ncbi:MAG: 2-C-methyl-D-erythritol 2,4-cyclodiphosphate synthase [Deltaproteobacteria bacterium]|nr:2-C-methyl-D-erythritol 2,4-cyclodiphosphate synthase [Deltaproteobacteria bacterium]
MRIGFGYDIHPLVEGRRLILGGVEIPSAGGLQGHSDADVLLHALCDALLGALGEGDIGRHFPDSDPQYRGISSLALLKRVAVMLAASPWTVHNIDSTVVLERPRIGPYVPQMAERIARILDISPRQVNIKATTAEGLGFAGEGRGAEAYACVLLGARG